MIKNNGRLASVKNNPLFVIEHSTFMNDLCDFLRQENPNFDERKFREATGEILGQ